MISAELEDAASVIVTTRDFCGNEVEALRDWEADHRVLSDQERFTVVERANQIWRASQP
jgi:hypothetical protein